AARAAAQLGPWMHLRLPRAGDERPRVFRVHRESGTAGVLVDEQHAIPMLAGVRRTEDAALLLLAGQPSLGADENAVRVCRANDDARDAPRLVESRMGPRFSGVERLVDAVADDVAVTNR